LTYYEMKLMILGRVIINGEDISHTIIKAILDVLRDEFFFCERSGGQLASPGPVASRSQQVLSSIFIRSEFQAAERKKTPRCARRKAWPSWAWARVRGVSLPG